ncbi:hypothetical protein AVEN_74291-1 [Araneus ventricosus]|uniref:Peptidase aspartic putative domain-containing protein n=1 Tax=Araneus ventricosus TaxID=182803 RepID=A0A4Y2RUP1_ARAVE|nr:hypothetical protein AVEN_74291-1 [Araneus ventricosus]
MKQFEVLDKSVICDCVDPLPKGPWMKELMVKNIVITDTEESVSLLIGADIAATILTGRQENLPCGILAVETLLGWTVSGKPSLDEGTENFAMLATSLLIKEASITYIWNLEEWSKLVIIEEVSPDDVNNFGHYLPHRPVIKQEGSTKVRPVFDASAWVKSTPSSNQYLNCGPNLIEFIPSLLLRFRERKYGVSADIEKAFLQINVRKSDRDYLRFHGGQKTRTIKGLSSCQGGFRCSQQSFFTGNNFEIPH